MTSHARPATKILQAYERVKLASPPGGPGWSVCFLDAQDRSVAAFSLASYSQLEMLADEVAALGYSLTVLDDTVCDTDFVFRENPGGASSMLSETAAAPPRPNMPAESRLPISKGDLVMEDSGGPIMLVSAIGSELAYCVWFSEAAAVLSGTFSVARLVNVSGAKRRLEAVCAAAGQPGSTATL
jgi:uncharacterized protein YodC (DUF2158 family)